MKDFHLEDGGHPRSLITEPERTQADSPLATDQQNGFLEWSVSRNFLRQNGTNGSFS
jgi:hypothetical protein